MSKAATTRIVQTGLLEHPAVQAWRELQPARVEPERIDILKGKRPDQIGGNKRFVCRLVGVGPAGTAVIGKRSRCANALVENAVYTDVLSHLPVPSPNYYGMLEETNGKFCWLFLEDAGEQGSFRLNGEHRELAAQWLGLVHTSATHLSAPACLPDKGPSHYLKRLQLGRNGILENLVNLAHLGGQLAPLETIVRQFDLLESHWDRVEAFCEGAPHTLIHGDFAARNLRVRNDQAGMALLPFDWGEAGWGVPAVDIMQVDVLGYSSTVHGHWPWLDLHAIQRLAIVGKIFRCLDAVYWQLPSFKYEWLKVPIYNMGIYASRLADAIRGARLSSAAGSIG